MIKAGALLYAMFLVVVITIISSSFILVNYYNNSYVIHVLKEEQLFHDVNSGINYGMSFYKDIPFNNKIEIDLYDDGEHKVKLGKKHWGAFYVITSESKWRNKFISKSVLVGNNINEGEKIALYLTDQNKPLSLTGRTIITGNCYLPKAGVKRAYIEGKSFIGNKLINGLKFNSNKTLPPINEELIRENEKKFFVDDIGNDSLVDYDLVMEQDSIVNSFQNKTLVLYSPLSIELSNQVIEGNIIVKSNKKITVKSTATITGAILYAKGIILENNFEGSIQIFATDSIIVEKDCKLHYPSVLALLGEGTTTIARKIIVDENVNLKGAIFLVNKNYDRKNQSVISIGVHSKIQVKYIHQNY